HIASTPPTQIMYILIMHTTSTSFYPIFFTSPRPHHPLRSFPTRRSSDLTPSCCSIPNPPPDGCRSSVCARSPSCAPARSSESGRSEEHTSELQSRFDLVCRLLLEKKKKNNRAMNGKFNTRILHTYCTVLS